MKESHYGDANIMPLGTIYKIQIEQSETIKCYNKAFMSHNLYLSSCLNHLNNDHNQWKIRDVGAPLPCKYHNVSIPAKIEIPYNRTVTIHNTCS